MTPKVFEGSLYSPYQRKTSSLRIAFHNTPSSPAFFPLLVNLAVPSWFHTLSRLPFRAPLRASRFCSCSFPLLSVPGNKSQAGGEDWSAASFCHPPLCLCERPTMCFFTKLAPHTPLIGPFCNITIFCISAKACADFVFGCFSVLSSIVVFEFSSRSVRRLARFCC